MELTPHVLVVDDDAVTVEVLCSLVHRNLPNVEVEGVDSPITALERVQTSRYAAVLTDLRMPGMDGLQLASHVHAVQPDTPVILITGSIDVQRDPSDNIFAWLHKPFDIDVFVATLHSALACPIAG